MAHNLASQAEMPNFEIVNWPIKSLIDLEGKVEAFRESIGLLKSTVVARLILRRLLKANAVWTIRRHQYWAPGMKQSKLYCLCRGGWCKYRDRSVDFLENEYLICVTNKMRPIWQRGNFKQDLELCYHIDCFINIFTNVEDESGVEHKNFAPLLKLTPFLDLESKFYSQHMMPIDPRVSGIVRLWCQQILYSAMYALPSGIYGPFNTVRNHFYTDDCCLYPSLDEAWRFEHVHFKIGPLAHLDLCQLLRAFHTQAQHNKLSVSGFVRAPMNESPRKRTRKSKLTAAKSSQVTDHDANEASFESTNHTVAEGSPESSVVVYNKPRWAVARTRSDSTEGESDEEKLWMTFKKKKPQRLRISLRLPSSSPPRQESSSSKKGHATRFSPNISVEPTTSTANSQIDNSPKATSDKPEEAGDNSKLPNGAKRKSLFGTSFGAYSSAVSSHLVNSQISNRSTQLDDAEGAEDSQPLDALGFNDFLNFFEADKGAVDGPSTCTPKGEVNRPHKRLRLAMPAPSSPTPSPDNVPAIVSTQTSPSRRDSNAETLVTVDGMLREMEDALPETLYTWTYKGITRPTRSIARQGQADIEQTARFSQSEARRLLAQVEELENLIQGQSAERTTTAGNVRPAAAGLGPVVHSNGHFESNRTRQTMVEAARELRLAAEQHLDTTEYCWNRIDEGLKEQTEWEEEHGRE